MKILGKQFVSFISRVLAMFLGIFQSLLIVNILSVTEYGVIGLVTAIAGIAGITQHLGLAASSTKEISQAKSGNEILNVVLASLSIRLMISVPVSLFLIFGAYYISDMYKNTELVFPLQAFGFVTLIQAFQSIMNSVISGTQRFKMLFTYQVLIAVLSLIIYVPLVYNFKLEGYFYSIIIFNLAQTLILTYLAFKGQGIKFHLPKLKEIVMISKTLLKISLVVYLVKILFTLWQEVPIVYLSRFYSLEMIALFTFAFNLASKLMTISDSVTDVNLPVYSKESQENYQGFLKDFRENFLIMYFIILFIGISISFWGHQILQLVDMFMYFVGIVSGLNLSKNIFLRFSPSLVFFTPLIISIIFYSFINILKSSVFVPLEKLRSLTIMYALLLLLTALTFVILESINSTMINMAIALGVGALGSFLYAIFYLKTQFGFYLLKTNVTLFTLYSVLLVVGVNYFSNFNLSQKLFLFGVYLFSVKFLFRLNYLDLILGKFYAKLLKIAKI